ncbi:MAG: phosphatidate cytidylyltransferase [Planctomycetota bacterium]
MLKQRIITAIILASILVGTIALGNSVGINLLFAVLLYTAARELVMLTLKVGPIMASLLAVPLPLLFWWSLATIDFLDQHWFAMYGLACWLLISISLFCYRFSGRWNLLQRSMLLIFALSLLWVCVQGLVHLQTRYSEGSWMLLYLCTLVWIADIGAYFSGKRFGKHKLAPAISPGKTWEGVVGGIAANTVWILLVYQLSDGFGLPLIPFLIIGLVTSVLSVVGDLFESILKREAGVKDSGKLLPGHGGILDRVDSIIAASPVFVAGLWIAGLQ